MPVKPASLRVSMGVLLALLAAVAACDDIPPAFVCGDDVVDCWVGQTASFENATCSCLVEIEDEMSSVEQCLDVVFDGGPTSEQADCLREVVADYPDVGDGIRCIADVLGDVERCVTNSGCDRDTIDCLNFSFSCGAGSEEAALALDACGDLIPNFGS